MTRILRLVVLATASLALYGAAPAAAPADRAVAGRLFDAATGLPVQAAQVSVIGTGQGSLTDQEGRFLIRGVPAGGASVVVLLHHPCFHPTRVEVADPGDVVLEVGLPFRPEGPEARLGQCSGYGGR